MTTASYQPRVTAGMPLDLLVAKLERAGGGGLTKRQRAALRGLALLLPHGSAAGRATTAQVGAVVGYSAKWMGQALCDLEGMGLVDYHRGGVVAGAPQPSVFRVAKDVLCSLVREGAEVFAASTRARAASTRARLAGLTLRPRHKRRSAHAEQSSHLSPYGEGSGTSREPITPSEPPDPGTARQWADRIRREQGWLAS